MSQSLNSAIAVIGIDIGKNSFHVVGLDDRGAIVLRQKWSRGQIEVRLANMPPCLIGMEACVGAHQSRGRGSGWSGTALMGEVLNCRQCPSRARGKNVQPGVANIRERKIFITALRARGTMSTMFVIKL